jgi:VWFA-related protein
VCLAATAALSAQRATFSSRLEAVRVDVSVTSGATPIEGLTAGDFDVRDNGVPQQVQLLATDEIPLDVVLAFDVSASVRGERHGHLMAAAQAALDALRDRDKAALITFTHGVQLRVPLTGELARIRNALDAPVPGGRTSMIDAAFAALAQADAGSGRALAIVFSDGVDTGSWLTTEAVIQAARRVDAVLFGISTGAPRRSPVEDLAEAAGGDLIRIESTRQLSAAVTSLLGAFRQRYLLSYEPQNVTPGGWHKLEVRVKRRGATVRARAGYFGSS